MYFGSIAAFSLAIAACDADPSAVVNDPEFQLRGTVENSQSIVVGEDATRVYLVWLPGEGESLVIDEAPVGAGYPVDFVLDVTTPPPDTSLRVEGDASFAFAKILVMTPAQRELVQDQLDAGDGIAAGVIGSARGGLYYLTDDEAAAAFSGENPLRAGAVAGFNLAGDEGSLVPLDTSITVDLIETGTAVEEG